MNIMTALLFLSLANADEMGDQAEYQRLSIEMEKMSKNNVWTGVNKRFQDLEDLGVDIQFDHYVLGAQAAQELGDLLSCKKRLARALELKPKKKQIRKWYDDIDSQYGYVALFSTAKEDDLLQRHDVITDPVQSQAIIFAQGTLAKKGEFEGLLPVGSYSFSSQDFHLRAGIVVHLEISPRMRRLDLKRKNKNKTEKKK
jgi:hypothetical protein